MVPPDRQPSKVLLIAHKALTRVFYSCWRKQGST